MQEKRFYLKDGGKGDEFLSRGDAGSSKRPGVVVVILFVVVFFVVVVLVGLYLLGAHSRKSVQKHAGFPSLSPTSTPLPMASVSATPSGSLIPSPSGSGLERSKLRVSILNGSGVGGAAQVLAARLSGLGYIVASVGNAEGFSYRSITVLVKKSKSGYAQLLKNDLSEGGASVSASLSDEITGDAEVIIGKK